MKKYVTLIVEIRNNKLVPIKLWEADLIKELDNDIYKLHVVKPADNILKTNPKTYTPIIIIISLLTILMT